MKKIVVSIVLVCSMISLHAQTPKALIDSATNCYNKGRYEQAADFYKQVLAKGFESADVYYNIGNASFKTNDLASAILYYEKALKLAPGDEDIRYNLKVANSLITDKIDVVPDLFYEIWWKTLLNLFSGNTWAWVGIVFLALALASFGVFVLAGSYTLRKASFILSMTMLVFMLFSTGFALNSTNRQLSHAYAIIFDPAVTVKSSPDDSSTDLFVLHEGTKVNVTDKVNDWIKVKLANGNVGWILAKSIKEI